jgi:hypothetical protein
VQMGYHRAGWYTYPWVDRYASVVGRHCARRRTRHCLLPRGGLDVRRRLVLHSTHSEPLFKDSEKCLDLGLWDSAPGGIEPATRGLGIRCSPIRLASRTP